MIDSSFGGINHSDCHLWNDRSSLAIMTSSVLKLSDPFAINVETRIFDHVDDSNGCLRHIVLHHHIITRPHEPRLFPQEFDEPLIVHLDVHRAQHSHEIGCVDENLNTIFRMDTKK